MAFKQNLFGLVPVATTLGALEPKIVLAIEIGEDAVLVGQATKFRLLGRRRGCGRDGCWGQRARGGCNAAGWMWTWGQRAIERQRMRERQTAR